jgi:hypothetical protein
MLSADNAAVSSRLVVEALQVIHAWPMLLRCMEPTTVLPCRSLESTTGPLARMREQIRNLRRSNNPVFGADDATCWCITSLLATVSL